MVSLLSTSREGWESDTERMCFPCDCVPKRTCRSSWTPSQCGGDVYLKSPEGDIFNLKSSMSRYIAIGRLIEEQGDTLELFADRKEDQARLMPLVEDLMKNGD